VKLPFAARKLTRRAIGVGNARAITPEELHALAREEDVIVIGVGIFTPGPLDPRLPGTQRAASLLSLKGVVADVPRQQAIALHCG
jgi:hypothetical protein